MLVSVNPVKLRENLAASSHLLACVLQKCLPKQFEHGLLPGSQCGFCAVRGIIDMIFAARQLQKKRIKQHKNLCMTFDNLTETFDTVCRETCERSCLVAQMGSCSFTMG